MDAPPCIATLIGRDSLRLPGAKVFYIDPQVLSVARDGEILIAGSNNIRGYRNSKGVMVRDDHLFGAVLHPNGTVETVHSPVPTRLLRAVRAAPRVDGGWDVLFGQTAEYEGLERPSYAVA